MWNDEKRAIVGLWGKIFGMILFAGLVFLLSGSGRSYAAGREYLKGQEKSEEQESTGGQENPGEQENPRGQEKPEEESPEEQKSPEKTKEELVAEKKKKLAAVKDGGKFIICAKRISASKVKLSWKKADHDFVYHIYRKDAKGQTKLLKKGKNTSYTVSGLDKSKKYKFYVEIYYAWEGAGNGQSAAENIYMDKSLPLTIITGGKHFMNIKKLQAKRESVTLRKKQMHSVRCRIWLNKEKLVYGKPKLYYYSTAPSVAKVDGDGRITAKKKGKAVVFVIAPNGVYDKVSVNVK